MGYGLDEECPRRSHHLRLGEVTQNGWGCRGRVLPGERGLGPSAREHRVPLLRSHGWQSTPAENHGAWDQPKVQQVMNDLDAFVCLSVGNTLSPARSPITVAKLLILVYIQPRFMNTSIYL